MRRRGMAASRPKAASMSDKAGKETILDIAAHIVDGPREKAYGHPAQDFARIAGMWSTVLGVQVTPEQVGLCMILVKISRETNLHSRDNLVDIAGYARTIEKLSEHGKIE